MDDTEISSTEQQSTATEPVFLTDHVTDRPNDVSWVVGNDDGEDSFPNNLPEETSPVEETSQEESSEDSDQEERPRKKRNSSQHRITELNRQKKAAQEFAHQILKEKENLEKRLTQSEQQNLINYEKFISSEKERLKVAKFSALEEGDTAKITEVDDLMSQYNNELMDLKRRKEVMTQDRFRERPAQELPREIFEESDASSGLDDESYSAMVDWAKKNPWANPESRYYDEGMFLEADAYSAKLKRRYLLERREEEIGTPGFFSEITDYMEDVYSVEKTPEAPVKNRNMTMRNPNTSQVASVSHKPSGVQSNKSKEISLTPEQKEIARSLRGFVKDKNGVRITDNATLEAYYSRNIRRG